MRRPTRWRRLFSSWDAVRSNGAGITLGNTFDFSGGFLVCVKALAHGVFRQVGPLGVILPVKNFKCVPVIDARRLLGKLIDNGFHSVGMGCMFGFRNVEWMG